MIRGFTFYLSSVFRKEIKLFIKTVLGFFNYPIFTISIGFIFGAILGEMLQRQINYFYYLFFIIYLAICLKIFRNRKQKLLLLFLIFLVVGLWRYQFYYEKSEKRIENFANKNVTLVGKVIYDPDIRDNNVKLTLTVEKFFLDGRKEINTDGLILATTPRYPVYYYGDKLELTGIIKLPENFNDFDYNDYLRTQNIFVVIEPYGVTKLDNDTNFDIIKIISDLKLKIGEVVKKNLLEPHASLLLGILMGNKENMPNDFDSDLSVTSTTHIIAVSGYNVTILLGTILALAGLIPRRIAILISAFILILFLILVGLNNIPALRAGIIGFALLIALSIGRRGGIISFIPLSAAILIFFNPLVYKTVSFQLSFISTLGLICFSSYFEKIFKNLPESLRSELAPTLSATISTMPIILWNFGQISIISVLVNMLVLPVIPVIMFLGFIYICSLPINGIISACLGFVAFIPLEYLVRVIKFFGQLDSLRLNFGRINQLVPIIILVIIIYLAFKVNIIWKE